MSREPIIDEEAKMVIYPRVDITDEQWEEYRQSFLMSKSLWTPQERREITINSIKKRKREKK